MISDTNEIIASISCPPVMTQAVLDHLIQISNRTIYYFYFFIYKNAEIFFNLALKRFHCHFAYENL